MRRVILLAIAFLAACSTLTVQTDYNPAKKQEIASYRTYQWIEKPVSNDARMNNPIMRDLVRTAVDRQVQRKGMKPAPEGATPDVRLAWIAVVHQHVYVDQIPAYWGYSMGGWYGPGWGFGFGFPSTYVDVYDEGTIVVDIIDTGSNELVWRGVAAADLEFYDTAEERAKLVEDSVKEMFEDFPPR